MSQPKYAIGSKDLPGGKTWIDKDGMPACIETHPTFEHKTCSICGNACITFGFIVKDTTICSACIPT